MKRFIGMSLAFVLMFSIPFNVFALDYLDTSKMSAEQVEWYEEFMRQEEEIQKMKDNMEPDFGTELDKVLSMSDYGGMYLVGDVLHIVPVNTEAVQKALTITRGKTRAVPQVVVEDRIAKYSMQELMDAQERISEVWDSFDYLRGTAPNDKENTLDVYGADEWTEERKAEIIAAAGVDSVAFYVKDIYFDYERESPYVYKTQVQEPSYANPLTEVVVVARMGSRIFNVDQADENGGRPSSTLGCAVKGDIDGWITTAHGPTANTSVSEGNFFKVEDAYETHWEATLGSAQKVLLGGKFDVALIEYDTQYTGAVRTSTTKYNLPITGSIAPKVDQQVYILGYNKKVPARIIHTSLSAGSGSNLLEMEFTTPISTQDGDSGGAVVVVNPDQQGYSIVGLYKGRQWDEGDSPSDPGDPIATRWDNIAREFGVEVF